MGRTLALGSLLLLGVAGPALAQAGSTMPDPAIPCGAFARADGGDWTVLAPVMLDFRGMLVSFTVGTRLPAGSTAHGLAVPVILDRECGNGPSRPLRRF